MTALPLILLIADDAELRASIQSAATALNYRVQHGLAAGGDPVAQIADAELALIVIEGAALPPWLAAVRASPATRRLPVLIVGDPAIYEAQARDLHIPAVISGADLRQSLPGILVEHARVFNAAEQLAAECETEPSAEVLKGLREFNAHDYFECHETMEAAWNHAAGPVRDLYRVILQVGLAYYQIERGNYYGALKMFLRSVQWFSVLPDHCQGIDVAQLHADASAARAHLESLGPHQISQFDRRLLKPVLYSASHEESV